MPYWNWIRFRLGRELRDYFTVEDRLPIQLQNLVNQLDKTNPWSWSR